jgi:hypothetical protein
MICRPFYICVQKSKALAGEIGYFREGSFMNKNTGFAAFVLGLTSGIFNLFLAAAATFGGVFPYRADNIIVLVLADIACALNFAGACVCRKNRPAGGMLMLLTALPLLIFAVLAPWGAADAHLITLTEFIAVFAVAELVSVAAAILCFSHTPAKQSDYYYEHADNICIRQQADMRMGKLVRDLYEQPAQQEQPADPQAPQK